MPNHAVASDILSWVSRNSLRCAADFLRPPSPSRAAINPLWVLPTAPYSFGCIRFCEPSDLARGHSNCLGVSHAKITVSLASFHTPAVNCKVIWRLFHKMHIYRLAWRTRSLGEHSQPTPAGFDYDLRRDHCQCSFFLQINPRVVLPRAEVERAGGRLISNSARLEAPQARSSWLGADDVRFHKQNLAIPRLYEVLADVVRPSPVQERGYGMM
ncbi:hypothetical protein DFH09DRAFT_1109655 [Mycena vulgaris]|nr:hypothetical protein DFH09DRAFT_1109655 [Mycena vulgaris]